jgi:hypothetical protein
MSLYMDEVANGSETDRHNILEAGLHAVGDDCRSSLQTIHKHSVDRDADCCCHDEGVVVHNAVHSESLDEMRNEMRVRSSSPNQRMIPSPREDEIDLQWDILDHLVALSSKDHQVSSFRILSCEEEKRKLEPLVDLRETVVDTGIQNSKEDTDCHYHCYEVSSVDGKEDSGDPCDLVRSHLHLRDVFLLEADIECEDCSAM